MKTIDIETIIEDAYKNSYNELDLSGMNLEEIPKSIGKLTSLKKLT